MNGDATNAITKCSTGWLYRSYNRRLLIKVYHVVISVAIEEWSRKTDLRDMRLFSDV